MNAIEIRNLSKSFRGLYAVDNLNTTVPVDSIYGFIGEALFSIIMGVISNKVLRKTDLV